MDDRRFYSLVKTLTTGGSRRGLLHTFSAGALAAVIGRLGMAEGADARKKRTKKAKKGDVNKRCKTQIGGCIDILTPACADNAVCLANVQRCCPALGTCDIAGFFACLEANAT